MTIRRTLVLAFAFVGITLAIFSLSLFQTITGNVVGTNLTSKVMGVFGILFMIIAVIIEKFEMKNGNR